MNLKCSARIHEIFLTASIGKFFIKCILFWLLKEALKKYNDKREIHCLSILDISLTAMYPFNLLVHRDYVPITSVLKI